MFIPLRHSALASTGGPPDVGVALAVGFVAGFVTLLPGDGGGGGGAAMTSGQVLTITIHISLPLPASPPDISLLSDNYHAPLVHANPDDAMDDAVSSLLPSAANSSGGRDPLSEGPLGDRQFGGRSLEMSTVTSTRAALRGGCLPTGRADALAFAAHPRPAAASLLPPSFRPQPGRADQHDLRARQALRVVERRSRSSRLENGGALRRCAQAE